MQKIPTLFKRDYEGNRHVYNEVVEGCEWVINGEGVATRKWDGTCCLVRDGNLYKRYDAKKGRTPPDGFEPAQPKPDAKTGHWPGWVPVSDGPDDQYHREAWDMMMSIIELTDNQHPHDGTYELVGPKVQGNPEDFVSHALLLHGAQAVGDFPRDYVGIKTYLQTANIEGVVWHHPDGRMCKIKAKDFGIKRGN